MRSSSRIGGICAPLLAQSALALRSRAPIGRHAALCWMGSRFRMAEARRGSKRLRRTLRSSCDVQGAPGVPRLSDDDSGTLQCGAGASRRSRRSSSYCPPIVPKLPSIASRIASATPAGLPSGTRRDVPSGRWQAQAHPRGLERSSIRGSANLFAASVPSRFTAQPSSVRLQKIMAPSNRFSACGSPCDGPKRPCLAGEPRAPRPAAPATRSRT